MKRIYIFLFLFGIFSISHSHGQFIGITGTGTGINYTSYNTFTSNLSQIRPYGTGTASVTVYQDFWRSGFGGGVDLTDAKVFYKTNSATLGVVDDGSWTVVTGTLADVGTNDRGTFNLTAVAGTEIMFYIRFNVGGTFYYSFDGTTSPHTALPTDASTQLYKIRFNASTTYNAKRIDGNYVDWQTNEKIHTSAGRDWSVTWDDTYIYVRLEVLGVDTDRINLAIDNDPSTLYNNDVGTFSGVNFRGYLTPEYIVQSTSITNLNLYARSGTSWSGATDVYGGGANLFRSAGDAEFRIARSSIGLSSTSNSFALYCWLSNSGDTPYAFFATDNASAGGRARTATVWNNSGSGVEINTADFMDYSGSETRTASLGSAFRNLYVSNNNTTIGATTLTGNVIINTGGTLILSGGDLTLQGNFTNDDTYTDNNNTTFFTGTAGEQTIGGTATTTINEVVVNKTSGGNVKLLRNLVANGYIDLDNVGNTADFDLNGFNVDLGTTGSVFEDLTNNNIIKDLTASTDIVSKGGYIAFQRTVTAASTNLAETGLTLFRTGGSDYVVNVKRYHCIASGNSFNKGAKKIFEISGTPTGTTTLKIKFITEELGSVVLADMIYKWHSGVWKAANDASVGMAVSTAANEITASGAIASFSHWTVGGASSPLPISLTSFTAEKTGEAQATLRWTTATETNNKGFFIEKSTDGRTFETLGFVEGAGKSLVALAYSYQDNSLISNAYYRLRQEDFDGTIAYTNIVWVETDLLRIFPNPTSQSLRLSLQDRKEDLPISLHDAQGKEVWRGVWQASQNELNVSDLPRGTYLLKLNKAGKQVSQKIVLR